MNRLAPSLPVEIVLSILRHAARGCVHECRADAVNIAVVCSDVYRAVIKDLYHTMVITSKNVLGVRNASSDPLSRHIFLNVRHLVVTVDTIVFDPEPSGESRGSRMGAQVVRWDIAEFARLFSGVTDVDVPLQVLRVLASAASFHPTRLAVRYATFPGVDAPVSVLRSVTHLTGLLPLHPDSVNALIAAAPSLTHLAFDFARVMPPGPQRISLIPQPDPARVATAVLAALKHTRLCSVCISGISRDVAAGGINDRRVRVCMADPSLTTAADEESAAIANAWAGRDVWAVP